MKQYVQSCGAAAQPNVVVCRQLYLQRDRISNQIKAYKQLNGTECIPQSIKLGKCYDDRTSEESYHSQTASRQSVYSSSCVSYVLACTSRTFRNKDGHMGVKRSSRGRDD